MMKMSLIAGNSLNSTNYNVIGNDERESLKIVGIETISSQATLKCGRFNGHPEREYTQVSGNGTQPEAVGDMVYSISKDVAASNFTLCKICNELVYIRLMKRHLVQHSISAKDYFDTYVDSSAIKDCLVCGKKLTFKSVINGYGRTCSRTCRGVICGNATKEKHPDHLSRAGKKSQSMYKNEMRQWGSIGGKLLHKMNPNLAKENGKKGGKVSMAKLHSFRRETGFYKIEEKILWENAEFQKLGPAYGKTIISSSSKNGRYSPDFMIGNLVIEINGSWHNKKHIQERDQIKYQSLKDAGYQLLILAPEDILNDIANVIVRVKAVLI